MVTGQLSALQAYVSIGTDGTGGVYGSVGVNIQGTFNATLTFEATTDGTNWFQAAAIVLSNGLPAATVASTTGTGSGNVGSGQWFIPTLGYQQVRVRVTSYTSGTAYVFMDAAMSPAGLLFANTEGQKASYAASSVAQAVAASPTDIAGIQGSATKVVRITRVIVGLTTASAAAYQDVNLVLRRGGSQGAFSNSLTAAPLDGNDTVATAAAGNWTANPTLGTSTGVVAAQRFFASLTGTPALLSAPAVFDFGNRPSRCPVLRGTNQYLCVNLNGGTANASTGDVTFEWTEE